MNVGPLRRLFGFLGLLALAPTAVMLAMDQITPIDAAVRAVATLFVVVLLGRGAGLWVGMMARGYERKLDAGDPDGDEGPRRRAEDGAPATAS
jgi:hypothetical protein